mmetsp:Transcript_41547/g.98467  ORF Transcript_41547/g.98467 Transcript_41547/m.98467 type:complete len:222 (+) Transcript_41547:1825-2490(+)
MRHAAGVDVARLRHHVPLRTDPLLGISFVHPERDVMVVATLVVQLVPRSFAHRLALHARVGLVEAEVDTARLGNPHEDLGVVLPGRVVAAAAPSLGIPHSTDAIVCPSGGHQIYVGDGGERPDKVVDSDEEHTVVLLRVSDLRRLFRVLLPPRVRVAPASSPLVAAPRVAASDKHFVPSSDLDRVHGVDRVRMATVDAVANRLLRASCVRRCALKQLAFRL